jgi:hypothetical protein
VISAAAFSAAAPPTWQELSARLFTNGPIVWQAPTDKLPKSFWIYQRKLPRIFSATVITNAVVLGSLQSRGFPRPSTNDFFIWEQEPPNWPGPIPALLNIQPGDACLSFSMAHSGPISEKESPNNNTLVESALKHAVQLGLDPARLPPGKIYTRWCDDDQAAHQVCGRGIFFARRLDGVSFFSAADDGEGAEGFSMDFGEHGKIQAFSVRWSALVRYKNEPTASLNEITRCLRAHKTLVLPSPDEENYFARLKNLANANKLTINKITPYYGEGVFGEVPTNDVPAQFATPFAELEAVADFGNSNTPVRLLVPIIVSEANRLLKLNGAASAGREAGLE